MAAGDTSVGTGATLTFTNATSPTDVKLTSISIDGPEATTHQSSHLSSTTLHSFIVGDLLDPGTCTAEGFFDSTLDADAVVGTNGSLVILTGAGSTWTYADAICTGFSANIPLEDPETCSISFKLNGALTIT
jgi:hypothetical protein